MHHSYSDTEKDPHSPHFFEDIWRMMRHTSKIFHALVTGEDTPDPQFTREYIPVWNKLDNIGDHWLTRLSFCALYVAFYIAFAPNLWFFLLLPVHFLMGPIQGAIVNWFGHKLGYSNFDNGDYSKNTTPLGIILMGELFQNNHHYKKNDPNFAKRWFEFDFTYQIMRCLHFAKVIKLKPLPVQV
jgi:stearoyl-CoA desaturase (delta-9 desaturase)